MPDINNQVIIWQDCLLFLGKSIPADEFNTWIKPLQFKIIDGKACLYTPNKFVAKQISDNYISLIRDSLFNITDGEINHVTISVGQPLNHNKVSPNLAPSYLSESNLKFCSKIDDRYTFDNFIRGDSNFLAYSSTLEVTQQKNILFNPLLLYGQSGLGKTHLMHSICNKVLADNKLKIIYANSERFFGSMIRSIQTGGNAIDSFKKFYRSADILLIDDIQFFAGKDRTQQEFFHMFNSLLDTGKQMIFTSDKYPKDINGLDERIRTRIGSGLAIMIDPPEIETRTAILINKGKSLGYDVSDDVAFFIAKKIQSNVRELEGALKLVIAHANLRGEKISISLVNSALKDLFVHHDLSISIDSIQKTVCDYYRVKMQDFLSKKRHKFIVLPRQIAMGLVKELTNYSFPEIGKSFGGRDHTTVIHSCKKIERLRQEQSVEIKDYDNIKRIITQGG